MNSQNPPTPSASSGGTGPDGRSTETGDVLAGTKTAIAETARETATKVKSAVSSTATRAKDAVERVASEKKATAANRIGGYSAAIHDSARTLEEKDPNIAWFTHRTADKLQDVADYMRSHDFSDFRYDAENLARRHPAVFFGGMFVAGLILGNVVKASRRKLDHDRDATGRSNDDSDESLTSRDRPYASQPDLTDPARSAGSL